jgi:hypothetical protein
MFFAPPSAARVGDEIRCGAEPRVALELRHRDMKGKEPLHEQSTSRSRGVGGDAFH